jgi:hypothetical protein
MIDFSAFPSRKSRIQPWQIALSVIGVTAVVFAFGAFIEQSTGDGSGLAIIQITVIIIVLGLFITLIVVVIWFISSVLLPRIKNLLQNEHLAYQPAYDTIAILRQFSTDNGFEIIEYPFETPAPAKSYTGIARKREGDDIYVLYQLDGVFDDISFTYYCLGFAEGSEFMGDSNRRAFAYSSDSSGRRVEYITVLTTDHLIRPWYKGPVNAINSPNGYVYCSGQVLDRNTIHKMFKILLNN